jgi:hypothetical protein
LDEIGFHLAQGSEQRLFADPRYMERLLYNRIRGLVSTAFSGPKPLDEKEAIQVKSKYSRKGEGMAMLRDR